MKHIIVTNEVDKTYRIYRKDADALARAAMIIAEEGAGFANVYQFIDAESLVNDGVNFIVEDYVREKA